MSTRNELASTLGFPAIVGPLSDVWTNADRAHSIGIFRGLFEEILTEEVLYLLQSCRDYILLMSDAEMVVAGNVQGLFMKTESGEGTLTIEDSDKVPTALIQSPKV